MGTDGVKGTDDQTSDLNVHNTAISVMKNTGNGSSDQNMVHKGMDPETGTTSYMQHNNHRLCDKSEELSSRDISTCVQSVDYTDFCEKSVLDESISNHTLGDFLSDKNDTCMLADTSSMVGCEVSKRDLCEANTANHLCNSHDTTRVTLCGRDTVLCSSVALNRHDSNPCSELHSFVDLTNSCDIIAATKLGKDTIKKVNVHAITDKMCRLAAMLEAAKECIRFLTN